MEKTYIQNWIKILFYPNLDYFVFVRSDETYGHQALQDQYRAFHLGPGLSQLCLALKLFRLSGMFFLIFIFGSPKRTITTLPFSFLVYTANFLGPLEVLNGLFSVTFLP